MPEQPINIATIGEPPARRADPPEPARSLEGSAGQAAQPLTSGAFAQELIHHQIRRLGKLQGEVLADRDPEPLHQMRVSLRRLRTVLLQFGPALDLPESVSEGRIAAVARRTSLCRDLDVLSLRLKDQLLPRIPDDERRCLGGALKRLEQDRRQAFETLVDALRSSRYLKLLERLHKWQRQPRFTALGLLPLLPWLLDWHEPFSAGLFLHPGWTEMDPAEESLHGLRKRIKAARYSLEILEPWCGPTLLAWIQDLRQAQDHLGDLHDLQILNRNLADNIKHKQWGGIPVLQAELESQQRQHWAQWRELAQRLHSDNGRSAFRHQLLELGSSPVPA